MRTPIPLCALIAVAAAAPSIAAPVATLDPSQLRPGQKAEVRTVFKGDSIETFEAEIVGVLPGGRAEGDMILARATSERLAHLGVAQGMSGSPVYVDGKLIGALSSGWSFTREPLFGVTPIREMLGVLDLPTSPANPGSAGPNGIEFMGGSRPSRFRELRWDDGSDEPAEPALPAPRAGPAPLSLPLACGGLSPAALDPVSRWLAPLGFTVLPGGRSATQGPGPETLAPGSAVAVDVLRGDVQMSAIGTVTWRDGDRVLLFGHPFFQSGEVRMPLSTAEITAVIPNEASSFKLGVRGREVGVITQDRRAAVAGRLGGVAHMLPFSVTVMDAAGKRQAFRFETIEDRSLAPAMVGIAALNGLLESGGSGANQTLRWTLTFHRHGEPPLTLDDIAAGDAPPTDMVNSLSGPLRFLFNNPFDRLSLDSLTVTVGVASTRQQWTLRNARLLSAAVRPGRTLHVQCELERWRGGREWRELDIAVPEEAPDGAYVLWVGGGGELSRYEAKELPARYRPTSLADAWRRFAQSRSSDALYAALYAKSPEVTSEGRDYPELPVSALALLSSGQSAGDRSRRGDVAKLDERRLPLDGMTRGELLLQVRVDSKAP